MNGNATGDTLDDQKKYIEPVAEADVAALPGRTIAAIRPSNANVVPGMPVDVHGATMIVEQVLGDSDSKQGLRYVLIRRPAIWTMRGTTTTASIRGWPGELQFAVRQLRTLRHRDWTERNITDALAKAVGTIISINEPNVRVFAAVFDAVLDVSLMDRPNEWRIKVGLGRITETTGF